MAIEPISREAFLDRRCAGDSALRADVARLLRERAPAGDGLETPVWSDPGEADPADELPTFVGKRVGPYKLVRELGRGGMGAVFLGERADGLFRQNVAVKLVKRGMDTDFIVGRFRQERQFLASLNHPYIARLLDGGSTEDGLPYFVMELVEGKRIYEFVTERDLDLRQRLTLFCKVCEAVASAHARRIVHRDLKPSNILVVADGSPKLLDFGIAKLMNPDPGEEAPAPTATHMRLMTPEYASPEQAQGQSVSAASDVYSAGVLLYELATGRRPYRFDSRAIHDMTRVIREAEPRKPSEAVTASDAFEPSPAGTPRCASLRELSFECAGDLDNIVLTALRKNPLERYASIESLRADLLSYLSGNPVQARTFAVVPAGHAADSARRAIDDKALAVLPLKILGTWSADDSGSYLGVGLADTLITRLSQIRSFAVRPTSSILRFPANADPFEAGRELGVRYVLDGNLRRAGKLLRVTMQLLDVTREATVWAQQFHSQADEVLRLEDDISAQVARSLAPHLSGTEKRQVAKRGTNNEAAFQAYARGRFHWTQFTPESLLQAKIHFERAIELDPQYALAWVGMADLHNWSAIYGLVPDAGAYAKMRRCAEHALKLDSELGEAHATLGLAVWNLERDFAKAERHFQHAIELSPSYPHSYEWYGAISTGLLRTEEGTERAKKAEQLDPLSLRTKTLLVWQHYQAGLFDDALAKADHIVELDRNYPQGHFQRANVLEQLGYGDEAVAAIELCRKQMPGAALPVYCHCFALQSAGRAAEARRVAEELFASARTAYVKPWFLALTCVAIGEVDRAFAYFEQSFADYDAWTIWFSTEPKLHSIRRDPRYAKLLRRMSPELAARFA